MKLPFKPPTWILCDKLVTAIAPCYHARSHNIHTDGQLLLVKVVFIHALFYFIFPCGNFKN